MADNADIANDIMQDRLDALLAARRPRVIQASATWCDFCGDEIPQARRLAAPGCVYCIDCQSIAERRRG